MKNYLDLDRQFIHFQDEESWEIQYHSFLSDGFYGCESWADLLSHKRIVILAEAGAGKTAEMRERAKALIKDGSLAFYTTVTSLTSRPFRDALISVEDQDRFDLWLSNNEESVFFVDSVDEARLSGECFRDALSCLAKAISSHAERATIVVSCRVSDWRASQDPATFEDLLGKPPGTNPPPAPIEEDDVALLAPLFVDTRSSEKKDNKKDPLDSYEPYIAALAPLTIKEAKRLAEFSGVTDSDAFIAAVRGADAEDLVNRPQDLLSLSCLWNDKRTIGTKHEILKWSTLQRLHETNLDLSCKDTLSETKALEGAKLIAASLTFGKKRFIAWPLDTPVSSLDAFSLDPREALPDWAGREQQMLLNRAIFDPASHGRVRFHHRSVQELLCAEWLIEIMAAGCPVRSIWRLLAEEKYGTTRLRPTLRPITAWLAQLDERIRLLVIPLAPELLIEGGDPAILTTASREDLLEQFAATYRGRDDAGVSISIDQVSRLADSSLAGKINSLWKNTSNSGELRELLLRLIWVGKIEACSVIALSAAIGRGRYYERALGSRALCEIGTLAQRRLLANHLISHARSYPRKAFDIALQAVFPSILSLADLEKMIRKQPIDNMKSIHSGLVYGLSEIAKHSDLSDPVGFAQFLYKLANEKPCLDNPNSEYSKRYYSLCGPLAYICTKLIRNAHDAPVCNFVATASRFANRLNDYTHTYQIKEALKPLRKAVSKNIGANRQQFWLAIKDRRTKDGDLWSYRAARGLRDLWWLNAEDFDWLLDDLITKVLSNDRVVALSALLDIWSSNEQSTAQLQKIRDGIKGNHILEAQLDTYLNPPKRTEEDWEIEHKKRMTEIKQKRQKERFKIEESWRVFRDRLVANPDELAKTKAINDLCYLAKWLDHSNGRESHSINDWQMLTTPFSKNVAIAARDGFVAHWRTYDPGVKLARKNNTPWPVLVSLIGISIEANETDNFITNCSEQDVAIATRLALHEMNGFPNWAAKLWIANPSVTEPILRDGIRWEFGKIVKSGLVHHVVPLFAYTKEPLRSLAANWVLSELELATPRTEFTLLRALETITGSEQDFTNRLKVLAASRFKSERRIARRMIWLAMWFGVDANAALDALVSWINQQRSKSKKDALVIKLLNTMFTHGGYKFGKIYRDFEKLGPIVKLLNIVYARVRREDDIMHEGCYSPDERDNAEHGRSNLLGILLEIPGHATYQALMDMSAEPEHSISSERLRVLADQRATKDSDLKVWGPDEVVAFTTKYEKLPATLADLHEVIIDRLWDIDDDMRVGHFSNKEALRQDHRNRADERIVQLGIAEQLRLRAKGVYSLEREPELESSDKPDISIQRVGITESLPVEIKVADSWSYTQLSEAISAQLIGKYMQPRRATHGHLVITYHGKKQYWRPEKGKPGVAFSQLIYSLQKDADVFTAANSSVIKITVTGIDLTD